MILISTSIVKPCLERMNIEYKSEAFQHLYHPLYSFAVLVILVQIMRTTLESNSLPNSRLIKGGLYDPVRMWGCDHQRSLATKKMTRMTKWKFDGTIEESSSSNSIIMLPKPYNHSSTYPIMIPSSYNSESSAKQQVIDEIQTFKQLTEMYNERTWQMYFR